MLGSIKQKIQNVQNDLTSGLRNLVLEEFGPFLNSTNEEAKYVASQLPVNLNAGVEVLSLYQRRWQQMHEKNEKNFALLGEVEEMTNKLNEHCIRRTKAMETFIAANSQTNQLNSLINELEQELLRLKKKFIGVELILDKMESKTHDRKLIQLEQNMQLNYGIKTEQKQQQFEEFKKDLFMLHQKKVKEYEAKQLAKIQEKQNAFQAAFESELDRYRKYGKMNTDFLKQSTSSLNLNKSAESTLTLEQVELIPDSDAVKTLDEFLSQEAQENTKIKESCLTE